MLKGGGCRYRAGRLEIVDTLPGWVTIGHLAIGLLGSQALTNEHDQENIQSEERMQEKKCLSDLDFEPIGWPLKVGLTVG